MQRILEAEVMDNWAESTAYDQMDFSTVNQDFADTFVDLAPYAVKILDVGTGTARIPIMMAKKRSQYLITGVDLAQSMLILGRKNVEEAGLLPRIKLERVDGKRMPYPDYEFDCVVSNSLVHHLPNPLSFFQEVKRLVKNNGGILIRDLLRPENDRQVDEIVRAIGTDYDRHQTDLFRDSLKAAFTLDEITEFINLVGLEGVKIYQSSDRHWTISRPETNI